ncbi:MAG TPA: phosphoadenylyl-sulfate reductase [Aggregatilineales bacterium]|nr:phosphoadenylyl-sulfate reductase [Aggregatilineales bacterium]
MGVWTPDQLQAQSVAFEQYSPQAILRWATETFGSRLAVVTSFQPTGIVTLHMLSEISPDTAVLTLDTGLLFPETYALVDALEARLKLRLIRVRPAQTVQEQAASEGEALWARDPDRCCALRKVEPLDTALANYDAWVTGVRRDQSKTRGTTPIVSWDDRNQKVKLAPFATWTESMIWTYIRTYELPYNALHDRNYPSIGCWPCTQPVAPEATDKRSGRWSNSGKTECGIHTRTARVSRGSS